MRTRISFTWINIVYISWILQLGHAETIDEILAAAAAAASDTPQSPPVCEDEWSNCWEYVKDCETEPLVTSKCERTCGCPLTTATDDDSIVVEYDIRQMPNVIRRQKRGAVSVQSLRWRNNIVPYVIDQDVYSNSDITTIQQATGDWSRYTCLQFPQGVPVNDPDNYIRFTRGNGCNSWVGSQHQNQRVNTINLEPNCRTKGIILHEIGHAIGLYHEQSRPDRDNYVQIVLSEVISDQVHNFDKRHDINSRSVPYDYRSIMHYGKTAFSRSGGVTIRTLDPAAQNVIGNRRSLTFSDIKVVNLMYNCRGNCPTLNCPGEGFVGKDCQCWCPSDNNVYEACSTSTPPPPTCTRVISQSQSSNGVITSPNYPRDYDDDLDCRWTFRPNSGYSVFIQFTHFDLEGGVYCPYDYVRIRTESFCGSMRPGNVSSTTPLVITFTTDDSITDSGFRLTYRFIRVIPCSNPGTPVNGRKIGTTYTTGSAVQFLCNTGFRLRGDDTITCGVDGRWNGSLPTCERPCETVISQHELTSTNGTITSPNYPSDYENNLNCTWTFIPNWEVGYVILVEFTNMQLEPGTLTECNDYIQIRNESYCDINTLATYVSTRTVTFSLVTDGSVTATGFSARYSFGNAFCGNPGTPVNGRQSSQSYRYGFPIRFTCNSGYELVGLRLIRCLYDGQWSGPVPTCVPGPQYEVPGGQGQESDFYDVGDEVIFSCERGSTLIGPRVLECLRGGQWNDTLPRCVRGGPTTRTTCTPLRDPVNGWKSGSNYDIGSVVSFFCDLDYRLVGASSLTCESDGQWSVDPPRCVRGRTSAGCSPQIFSQASSMSGTFTSPNYPQNYDDDLNCTWTFEPFPGYNVLVLFTDMELESSIPDPCYDYILINNERYCDTNPIDSYVSSRTVDISLVTDGSITDRGFRANYTFGNAYCGSPGSPENGRRESNSFTYGFSASFSCDAGFQLIGESRIFCEADGQWSDPIPSCTRVCGGTISQSESASGTITTPNYPDDYANDLNCTWTFQPNNGYNVTIQFTDFELEDMIGNVCWDYVKIGTRRYCGTTSPRTVTFDSDTTVTFISDESFVFRGFIASYSFVRSNTISPTDEPPPCIDDFPVCGDYSGFCQSDPAVRDLCKRTCGLCGGCPDPRDNVLNGRVVGDDRGVGSIVQFECDPEHELQGPASIVCLSSLQWSNSYPRCERNIVPVPVDCGDPGSVDNARRMGSVFRDGSTVTYNCDTCYTGGGSVTCNNGRWSTKPSCNVITCTNPGPFVNGFRQNSMNSFECNTVLSHTCHSQFQLQGSPVVTCLSTGQWDRAFPTCGAAGCGDPPSVQYATNNRAVSSTDVGAYITYLCQSNYQVVGSPRIQCQSDGQWTQPPRCVLRPSGGDCGTPQTVANAEITSQTGGTLTNAIVTWTCNACYAGGGSVICQPTGQWSAPPVCTYLTSSVPCDDPGQIPNGRRLGGLQQYPCNSIVVYECDSGYTLLGSSVVTCGPNGQWSPIPTCVGGSLSGGCTETDNHPDLCPDWVSVDPNCEEQYLKTNCRLSCCLSGASGPAPAPAPAPQGCAYVDEVDPSQCAYRKNTEDPYCQTTQMQQYCQATCNCDVIIP